MPYLGRAIGSTPSLPAAIRYGAGNGIAINTDDTGADIGGGEVIGLMRFVDTVDSAEYACAITVDGNPGSSVTAKASVIDLSGGGRAYFTFNGLHTFGARFDLFCDSESDDERFVLTQIDLEW